MLDIIPDEDYVIGDVVAVGTGDRTVTGDVVPNPVEIGDTVMFQKMAARGISYTARRPLIDRGVTNEETDGLCIVMCDHIVGKFPPKEVTYDRPGAGFNALPDPLSHLEPINPLEHEQSK